MVYLGVVLPDISESLDKLGESDVVFDRDAGVGGLDGLGQGAGGRQAERGASGHGLAAVNRARVLGVESCGGEAV